MRFTVSQTSLSEAIAVVYEGRGKCPTLPILSGVLVKAGDGVLEFQTSNYTISIRHRIAARVDEEGQMVIPVRCSPISARPCPMRRSALSSTSVRSPSPAGGALSG